MLCTDMMEKNIDENGLYGNLLGIGDSATVARSGSLKRTFGIQNSHIQIRE